MKTPKRAAVSLFLSVSVSLAHAGVDADEEAMLQRVLAAPDNLGVLGLPPNPTEEQVLAAGRKFSLALHPDRHQGDQRYGRALIKVIDARNALIKSLQAATAPTEVESPVKPTSEDAPTLADIAWQKRLKEAKLLFDEKYSPRWREYMADIHGSDWEGRFIKARGRNWNLNDFERELSGTDFRNWRAAHAPKESAPQNWSASRGALCEKEARGLFAPLKSFFNR